MKKLALLALAAPALAGTPAPVVTAAPAPAPAESAWSVEVGASGSFAATELFRHCTAIMPGDGGGFVNVDASRHMKIDTIGLDMTLVRAITPNHAFTFRIAAADGSEIYQRGMSVFDVGGATTVVEHRSKASLRTISLMPGYRFTQPIAEKTSLFCGVSAGLVSQDVHQKTISTIGGMDGISPTEAASAWGIGAEAEAGVRYQICPDMDIFAAYQISGNNAHCIMPGTMGAEYKTHCQIHHGVRAGVGIKF